MTIPWPCDCGRLVAEGEHHCWMHHADEQPDGAYLVCGECCHVYRTAADLEREHVLGGSLRMDAADIFCCPECIHDF